MIMVMEAYVIVILAVLGVLMGSFSGATVWRLRARQLRQDKAEGEEVDAKEFTQLAPLLQNSLARDRSMCLSCHHELAWYDLIPLVSWVSTAGRCRYCRARIGYFEPLIEVGTSVLFVGSYLLWPYPLNSSLDVSFFVIWLVACVLLVILFAYDLKWFILPNSIVFSLIGVGVVLAIFHALLTGDNLSGFLVNVGASLAILSGLYYVLWFVSKGQWVGFGDVKLGVGLGLIISDWKLALLTLFAANLYGCLIVLPGLLSGKLSRKTHVPFGPLLIAGFITSMLVGDIILQWYLTSFV